MKIGTTGSAGLADEARDPGSGVPAAWLAGGYLAVLLYCAWLFALNGQGLQVVYSDSWIYTDMAKRLAYCGSLAMQTVFDLVYPPLYPAFLSLAFLPKEPSFAFYAVAATNAALYASCFFPLFFLLRGYSGLSGKQSLFGALTLAACTWTSASVLRIASEALYYPLTLWLVWMVWNRLYLRGLFGFVAFAAALAALPLTKALGTLFLPAFLIAGFITRPGNGAAAAVSGWGRPVLAAAISGAILISFKLYLAGVIPPGVDASGGYLRMLNDPALADPAYWLDRLSSGISWLLRGGRDAALPLAAAVALRDRKLLTGDRLFFFAAVSLAATLLLVPLFTPEDSRGFEHSRYYAPFAPLFPLMLLRWRKSLAPADFVVAFLLLLAGMLIGPRPLFWQEPARWHVGIYYAVLFPALFAGRGRLPAVFLSLSMLSSLSVAYAERRKPSPESNLVSGFNDARGVSSAGLELLRKEPAARLIVDRSWRAQEDALRKEYLRLMIFLPAVPEFAEIPPPPPRGPELVLSHRLAPASAGVAACGPSVCLGQRRPLKGL